MNISGVGETGVGDMGQIIGETGIGEMGVGETETTELHTSRPNYHFLRYYVDKIITYLEG